jgi:hypothetical protein
MGDDPRKLTRLKLEVARSSFLRTIEGIELGDEDGAPNPVRVLADLRALLPTFIETSGGDIYRMCTVCEFGDIVWVGQESGRQALAEELVESLLDWRARWRLFDSLEDPWILNGAARTLASWAFDLQGLADEGHSTWILDALGIEISEMRDPITPSLIEEYPGQSDPRGNRRRAVDAHFREERDWALANVGRRWQGIRVTHFKYGRGRNARKSPSPVVWGYADEAPLLKQIIKGKVPPGMSRRYQLASPPDDEVELESPASKVKEFTLGNNLRLLVLYQVKYRDLLPSVFAALREIDSNVDSCMRSVRLAANQLGLTLRLS